MSEIVVYVCVWDMVNREVMECNFAIARRRLKLWLADFGLLSLTYITWVGVV